MSLTTNAPSEIMAWVRSMLAAPPYFPAYVSTQLPNPADFYATRGTKAIFIRDTKKPAWASSTGWVYADGTAV